MPAAPPGFHPGAPSGPGRGPGSFIAGLRAFGTEPEQDAGPLPKVVVVRRRVADSGWSIAAARRLRHGPGIRNVQACGRSGYPLVVAEDVVDGDVDGDAPQPDLVAQGGGDVPLDVTGDLVDRVSP